jgi:hypothetical protein
MFNAFCLLASFAILYFILRYRVHVHVSIQRPRIRMAASSRTSCVAEVAERAAQETEAILSSRGALSSARKPGRRAEASAKAAVTQNTGHLPTATTRPDKFSEVPQCPRSTVSSAVGATGENVNHSKRGYVPESARSATRNDPTSTSEKQQEIRQRDIESVLLNLGAKKHRAVATAEHVTRNWPDADFDTQLRAAIQEIAA